MNDRKIVPFNTGRVQIGVAYQPKPSLTQAYWLERQTARRSPVLRWVTWSVLAFAALMLMIGRV